MRESRFAGWFFLLICLADGTVFHMKNDAICWPTGSFLQTLIFTISILVQNSVGEHFSKTHLPKIIILHYFVKQGKAKAKLSILKLI